MFQNEPYSKLNIKKLFVCATKREAQPILDHYSMKFKALRSFDNNYSLFLYMPKKDFEKFENISSLDSYELDVYGILVCGIGKINSAMNLTNVLTRFSVDKVINIGMCGGLTEDTKIGNLYRIDEVKEFDSYLPKGLRPDDVGMYGMEYGIDRNNFLFRNCIKHPEDVEYDYNVACVATGDEFIDSEETKNYVANISDLCDMEAYSIARVCFCFRKILLMFKMVSDLCTESSSSNFYDRDVFSIYDIKIKNLMDKIY